MAKKIYLNVEKFKSLRESKGLSQEALAYACEKEHLRVSIATIKRAELGNSVSSRTLNELSSFFGVLSADLIAYDDLLPAKDENTSKQLITVLWLRLDNPSLMSDVIWHMKRRGSIWQEQIGGTLIALFSNNDYKGKGYIYAQTALLSIENKLKSTGSFGFKALLCLSSVIQKEKSYQLPLETHQWFAKYSTLIPVNKLLVSTNLYNLSHEYFSYETQDADCLGLCHLIKEKGVNAESAFIGRNSELLEINSLLDSRRLSVTPVIVNISGMAGIGKSKLLPAIHEQALLRNVLIADIDLEVGWNNSSYSLTSELCHQFLLKEKNKISKKSLIDTFRNSARPFNQQLVPKALNQTLDLEDNDLISQQQSEESLLQDIYLIFKSQLTYQNNNLLITVDNLHLAEEASLNILKRLLATCKDLPLVCIFTSRTESEVGDVKHILKPEGYDEHKIDLTPLSETESLKICDGYQHLSTAYKKKCIEMAEGVPLFLIQLLSKEEDNGNDVPYSLQLLVESKLLRLDSDDLQVLELLSVCAAPLPLSSVEVLISNNDYSPERLIKMQLVKVNLDLGMQISHQLVQHILYQGLPQARRKQYHRVLASYIEKHLQSLPGMSVHNLARQFESADEFIKAANYQYVAASEFLQKGLYEDAEHILNKALSLLPVKDSNEKNTIEINIQLALSVIYKVKYGWVSSVLKNCYQKVEQLSDANGSDERLAMALFGLCIIDLMTLNFAQAEASAERFLKISEDMDDDQGRMLAYTALANILFWIGKHEKAEEAADSALALYKSEHSNDAMKLLGQDPRVLASCFGGLSASLLGTKEKTEQYRSTMLSIARSLNHDFSLAIAIQGSTWIDFHYGSAEEVLIQAQELDALSIKMGFPFYRGVAAVFIGWAKHRLYRDSEAIEIVYNGYHNWLASSGDKIAHSLYSTILAEIYIDLERVEEATNLLNTGIDFSILHNETCYLCEMKRLLALCENRSNIDSTDSLSSAVNTDSSLLRVRRLALPSY